MSIIFRRKKIKWLESEESAMFAAKMRQSTDAQNVVLYSMCFYFLF